MIPLTGNVQSKQIHRDRKQMSGCLGLGEGGRVRGKQEVTAIQYARSFFLE